MNNGQPVSNVLRGFVVCHPEAGPRPESFRSTVILAKDAFLRWHADLGHEYPRDWKRFERDGYTVKPAELFIGG